MTRRLFAGSVVSVAWAQSRFAVATVKMASDPEPGGFRHQLTPGGLTMRAVSMGYCIRLAFGLTVQRPWELSGPSWIDPPTGVLIDIAAKTGSPASPDEVRGMLRALLTQRFGLTTHWEGRRLPAYLLTAPHGHPRLRPSPAGERKIHSGTKPYELVCEHVTMADLALQLGPPTTTRPVVDQTNLPGAFDFTLDMTPYIADPAADVERAAFRAVREQLGLELKTGRGTFRVLVVDHVEKRPAAD
jgi:uncharacterized protein (TIGR03435 family)